MNKFLITLILLIFTFNLAACKKNKEPGIVPETGKVIDISLKNGKEVSGVVGDVLYLDLLGVGGSNYQWAAVSPVSSDCLSLKDHQVDNLLEPNTTSTSKWWLKIEKKCELDLQFDYFKVGTEPKESFKTKVISQ